MHNDSTTYVETRVLGNQVEVGRKIVQKHSKLGHFWSFLAIFDQIWPKNASKLYINHEKWINMPCICHLQLILTILMDFEDILENFLFLAQNIQMSAWPPKQAHCGMQ